MTILHRLALITGLTLAAPFSRAQAVPAPDENLSLKTAHFALEFRVGKDGRLYQRPTGQPDAGKPPERTQEAYP
ncbi:MAG TPA: hypothetical protein VMQ67_10820, partial [Candidatus Saccharimonadales bacterium]|nr:hypothetical protein [Candidatus Saccharimonadales bacterium]